MSWKHLIPGYSAAKILTSHIQGEDEADYAHCRATPSQCESDVLVAEDKCRRCVNTIMWNGLKVVLPLCGAGFVKGAVGLGLQHLAASMAKAAAAAATKSSAAAVMGPIGVGIAALAIADTLVALYKALDIVTSSLDAQKKYCECG